MSHLLLSDDSVIQSLATFQKYKTLYFNCLVKNGYKLMFIAKPMRILCRGIETI